MLRTCNGDVYCVTLTLFPEMITQEQNFLRGTWYHSKHANIALECIDPESQTALGRPPYRREPKRSHSTEGSRRKFVLTLRRHEFVPKLTHSTDGCRRRRKLQAQIAGADCRRRC